MAGGRGCWVVLQELTVSEQVLGQRGCFIGTQVKKIVHSEYISVLKVLLSINFKIYTSSGHFLQLKYFRTYFAPV